MRTLDRYVVRSFLTSAVLLLIVALGFRIVADLLFNMDEFVENNTDLGELLEHITTYYGYQSLMYFVELGGVIIVISAGFTLARMNHTNELTAMLASGVSLHRVILPMVVSAMCLGGLVILDREVLIPPNAMRLVIGRDEQREMGEFPVSLMPDANKTIWWSPLYRPTTGEMKAPVLSLRDAKLRGLATAASEGVARRVAFAGYRERFLGPDNRPVRPRTLAGWDITAATLSRSINAGALWPRTPDTNRIYTHLGPEALLASAKKLAAKFGIAVPPDEKIPSVSGIPPARDETYDMIITTRCGPETDELVLDPYVPGRPRGGRLNRPMFLFKSSLAEGERLLGIFHADAATWVPDGAGAAGYWALENGRFFHPTELDGNDLVLRQSSRHLDLLSTAQLTEVIDHVSDRDAAVLAKHIRFADPINNLVLLLVGLPFILSRERNIKASAGLSVLMVGSYFAFVHVCRLIDLPPMLAAFLPIMLFGTIAAVMLDSVKT